MVKLESLGLGRTNITDAASNHLAKLQSLKELGVCYAKVTDEFLIPLVHLDLQSLWIDGTQITDVGVLQLPHFEKLKTLYLIDTSVTNQALLTLGRMTSLRSLQLGITNITDDGLPMLSKLVNLRTLGLPRNANITEAGKESLKQSLPQLTIR